MKLNLIVRSFVLAGMIMSNCPSYAAEAPKDASAATQQANNALLTSFLSPITLILPMPIKDLSLHFLRTLSKANKAMSSGIPNSIHSLKKEINRRIR